ncbi:MAG: transporter ATP-binding protein [Herbinix sp.]|nr:transporter ATP-binding protein [Herbinix sp.]
MLNIRVNSMLVDPHEKNSITMDIDNCTLAGIYGDKKDELISLLSGLERFDGDVVLDMISMKGSFEEYIDNIAVITKDSIINTELSVNDFLDFFGTMGNAYDENYENRKKKLLQEFGLLRYINTGINYLKEIDRKKVKLISLFLKEKTLILLDTFMESFHKRDRQKIMIFLNNYAKDEKIVLIGSNDYKLLQSFSDRIYVVN